MNMTDSQRRQIVTNGEYVRARGKRAGLRGWGILMFVLGAVCGALGMPMVWELGYGHFSSLAATLPYLIPCIFAVCFLFEKASANIVQARQIDPGIPVSRINPAQLPEVGSLVRSSQEPVEAQKAVLLRAAWEEQNTPAEQLVRPSGIQE